MHLDTQLRRLAVRVDGSPSDLGARNRGLTIAALGVVFGDIGTSPLYTMQTVFARDATRRVGVSQTTVYGISSLIVWAVVLIVLVKYIGLIMHADNDGEGGIMALVSLLIRERSQLPRRLVMLGMVGAALFIGDSLITPAISVLSAVEGLELLQPSFAHLVVPVAVTIIVALFAIQRAGTGVVGRWFGPVMLIWFVAIGLCGLHGVIDHPAALRGLSPTYAIEFFKSDGLTAFLSLGAVVLAVTGAEALYADLGHFGAPAIRRAWLLVVFPALVLSYLGQGALILADPTSAAGSFFLLVPHTLLLPMVLLATVATVIASQAVISGAFSMARQASRLGYMPHIEVRHTSADDPGQVYVPVLNVLLLIGVLALVLTFKSSARLASAYGIAVTGTMTITAILFFARELDRRSRPRPVILAAAAGILSVDAAFLTANLVKIPQGGWLPLLVAAVTFTVMANWHTTHRRIQLRRQAREGPLAEYVEELAHMGRTLHRVAGTAIYLARPGDTTAPALRAVVERIHALHELVLIVTVHVAEVPHVPPTDQVTVDPLGLHDHGILRVRVNLGFDDPQSVPRALSLVAAHAALDGPIELSDATYFVSTTSLHLGTAGGRGAWRRRLYLFTARAGTDPVRYYDLPPTRTLTVGTALLID